MTDRGTGLTRYLMAAALAASLASPAWSQSADPAPLPDPNDRSDSFTIGAGAAYLPDYEGSNDYRIIPAAAIRGRVGGIAFFTRATYLYVDLVPRGSGKIELDAGPIAGVRLNRTGRIRDDLVDRLPEIDKAIEIGGFAGLTAHGLTNPYDSLSVRVDVVKDVGKAHGSTVITPTIDFGTPLSRTFYVGASLSADFVGGVMPTPITRSRPRIRSPAGSLRSTPTAATRAGSSGCSQTGRSPAT